MTRKKKHRSKVMNGLKPLTPFKITTDDGEELSWMNEVQDKTASFIGFMTRLTVDDWNQHHKELKQAILDYRENHKGYDPGTTSAYVCLRDKGLLVEPGLPKSYQNSRLQTVTARVEAAKAVQVLKNEDRYGKPLDSVLFQSAVDLSYGDNQLSRLTLHENYREGDRLLGWVVELRTCVMGEWFHYWFNLPNRMINRTNFEKICKPSIILKDDDTVGFCFKIQESYQANRDNGLNAGLDLGFVEPYTVAITNKKGGVVATFRSSGLLKLKEDQIERLQKHITRLYKIQAGKKAAWGEIGASQEDRDRWSESRLLEIARCRARLSRLKHDLNVLVASEVEGKIRPYHVRRLKVEKLDWLAGKPGKPARCKSWAYGDAESCLDQSLARAGVEVVKVSAVNSSQNCNKCGGQVRFLRDRVVWCPRGCLGDGLDRDVNAAVNLAGRVPAD